MIYTAITNIEYHQTLLDDSVEGETCWTINKNAKSGDEVVLYVCAPVSAIVAIATVVDEPIKDEDLNSMWFGSYFADMEDLRMLKEPIERTFLLSRFPDWRYWTQPRNSVAVPSQYESRIHTLIEAILALKSAKERG
jgi:hypothetical protein